MTLCLLFIVVLFMFYLVTNMFDLKHKSLVLLIFHMLLALWLALSLRFFVPALIMKGLQTQDADKSKSVQVKVIILYGIRSGTNRRLEPTI